MTPFFFLRIVLLFILLTIQSTLYADSDWVKKLAQQEPSKSEESAPTIGVRGLDEPGQNGDTQIRDYPAIERLEKLRITPEDLQQFKKEGKLP